MKVLWRADFPTNLRGKEQEICSSLEIPLLGDVHWERLHYILMILRQFNNVYRVSFTYSLFLQKEDSIEFNSFIISAAFWPSLSEDKVEPPEPVQKYQYFVNLFVCMMFLHLLSVVVVVFVVFSYLIVRLRTCSV